MKNKTKNIILILVIILSLLGLTLTIYHAKENIKEESMINEKMGKASPEISEKQNTEDNQKMTFSNNQNNKLKLTTPYVIIITIFALTLSLSLLYLIMNIKNKVFYKNKDKLTIYIMSAIILTFIISMLLTLLTNNYILNSSNKTNTTKENVVLDKSNVVSERAVDLSTQKTDVTITSGGTYTITGSFTNSVIIDATDEGVNLVLDNVTITNEKTAANGVFSYGGSAATNNSSSDGTTITISNSKITTNKGDTLYVTNTTAEINLENNTIINNDTNGNFLRIQKDSWGNIGSNGGTVTLNMTNQKASGNIVIDSISTLTINMTNNSYYEGMINNNNNAKSITLKLDKTSKIKLTGDTYITSLDNADTTNSNIYFNGYKLYVNSTAIN